MRCYAKSMRLFILSSRVISEGLNSSLRSEWQVVLLNNLRYFV